MPTNRNTINVSEEFELVTGKRLALESLIRIASGIRYQQKALNELALAARPSQDIPKNMARSFASAEEKMKDKDIPDVIKKLSRLELITKKTLSQILQLTSLDVDLLRSEQNNNITVDNFTTAISDFQRRTQTALTLRYVLQQRGVVIPPFKLPISQDSVYEQVEQLKQKENDCIKQIKIEINIVVEDTNMMMRNDSLPDEMKSELIQMNKAMIANLDHLKTGGLVTDIPHAFEVITLATPQSNEADERSHSDELAKPNLKEKANNDSEAAPKNPSFWWLVKKWIFSPWSTSWSSIKQKYQNQAKDK
jgi:hypothetical protein